MIEILEKGGVVLWVIIAVGLAALVVIIERMLFFRSIRLHEQTLQERLKGTLYSGRFEEALALCTQNLSPLASLLRVALMHRTLPEVDRKDALQNAASQEILRMEHNLHILGTVSHIAPLLGLLGTVTGIMNAFGILGSVGAISDPTVLAKGISEALLTTVGGILVAIPTVMFYNHFVRKVQRLVTRLEQQASDVLLMIAGRAN